MKDTNTMMLGVLERLKMERAHSEDHTKTKIRRVKIEQVNHAWRVRFLPVGLGESNMWFVRIGQHWHNKKPIICPKHTAEDFGGNMENYCPVCDLAEALNHEEAEDISYFGFKLKANLTWLTYCVVYEIDYGRGNGKIMSGEELIKPWQFQHYKSSFDELTDYFRRGHSASRQYSVLDLKKGNDFWATKAAKGIRLDRQDPGPIFELDGNFDSTVDAVYAAIEPPLIKIPPKNLLDAFARKAEEDAFKQPEETPSKWSESEEEGEEAAQTPRHSTRRMAAAPKPEEVDVIGGDNDQIEGAEMPTEGEETPPAPVKKVARPLQRPAAPAAKPAATSAKPVAKPTTATTTRPVGRPPGVAKAPVAAKAPVKPVVKATAPATARPPAAAAKAPARPPAAAAATAPAKARSPLKARPAPAQEASVDEEEDPGVAEEAVDQAPVAEEAPVDETEEPTPEEVEAEEGQEQEESQEEQVAEEEQVEAEAEAQQTPPPKTAHTSPQGNPSLRQRLLGRTRTT